MNNPHNPTGATVSDEDMEDLHRFTSSRGIQLVSDEVYHPVYHGRATQSAARLPHATVISDFSKAFPLSGIRTGWIIEHDAKRREQYWHARCYFTISNTTTGEMLAEIAVRNREIILKRSQEAAAINLRRLEDFMANHSEAFGWIRPQGGMTAFPWLVSGENSTAFCHAAAKQGILLAPGECFDVPSHFRLGFAASEEKFPQALARLVAMVESWAGKLAKAG